VLDFCRDTTAVAFKVFLLDLHRGFDPFPMTKAESNTTVDLFECKRREGLADGLGRISVQERVDNRVEGITPGPLLDVILGYFS
jgi:hypothetical protein